MSAATYTVTLEARAAGYWRALVVDQRGSTIVEVLGARAVVAAAIREWIGEGGGALAR